jgi:hypothetical protein
MLKNHHLAEARAVTISLVEMFALSAKCFSKGPTSRMTGLYGLS